MKTLSKLTLATLALAISGAAIAADKSSNGTVTTFESAPVTGGIELEVKMPEVLILYHWDKATINYKDLLKAIETGSGEGTYDLTQTDLSVEGNLDTSNTAGFNPKAKVNVQLKDSWAVRSIVEAGHEPNVSLSFGGEDSKLYLGGNTSSENNISLSDQKLRVNKKFASDSTDNRGASINLLPRWKATKGDILFKMDLSNANTAGSYTSATEGDETFKLTLTSDKGKTLVKKVTFED